LVSHRRTLGVLAAYWNEPFDRAAGFWIEAAAPLLAGQIAGVTDFGGDTERVLVVEDDEKTARLIDLALSSEGLAVSCVASVEAARARAEEWSPDVVVANVNLPDGTGTELAQSLRTPSGPLFLFLSHVDDEDLDLAEADAYVQKPFNPSVLVSTVDGLLRGEGATRTDAGGPEDLLERYALELAVDNVEERA